MGFGTQGATVTEGQGDFIDCPDDTYRAQIINISDTFKDKNPETGAEQTKVTIEFELLPTADQIEYGAPQGYTRMVWLTLTDNFLNRGHIDRKSKLYTILEAMGYDMSGPLDFDSEDWLGRELRVVIKHSEKGYPRIDDFMQARKPVGKVTPAAKREPVGAAAKRGGAPFGEDDEE